MLSRAFPAFVCAPGSSLATVTWPAGIGGAGAFLLGLGRAQHAAVGIEFFRGLGDAVEIEIGGQVRRGRGPEPTTEDTIVSIWSRSRRSKLDFALVSGGPGAGILGGPVGKQAAGIVDDRDPLRLEPGDGGGDEMPDRPHLLGFELAAHLEHDRGRRLGLVAREQRALGQHQVDAGGLHAVERADGARELAFERPQAIDVLDEGGDPSASDLSKIS